MKLFTIGFTQKPAERFFTLLADAGVERVIDIRLKPGGQLSGFANGRDLPFFLHRLNGGRYLHRPVLAPTAEILGDYRQDHDWDRYVERFETLMDERDVPGGLDQDSFVREASCLLCSEASPEQCHRRLVADRIARVWGDMEIVHLR
ncbi:MAG: DUF488 domain-containing protein [Chloroflexota bacterium]|nr:DUF488 domain-containing protein [Chloroflexota bacterium]